MRRRRRGIARQGIETVGHLPVATVAPPRRTLLVVAAILATVAGCASETTTQPAADPPEAGPTVEYRGPDRLTRPANLEAGARARPGSRVVAVTFFLGGRPLGTDSTAPYGLDVDPALLPKGRHELRLEAVDNLGRRSSAGPSGITVEPGDSKVLQAAPGASFARARAALERGDVTVKLAPGRYVVDELMLRSGSRLVGSGPRTVLSAPPGRRYWALLVAKGRNIRISDLTVQGGGPISGESDGGISVAVFDGSTDVRLQRLHLSRVRTDGVNTWGAHRNISIQDSRIEGSRSAEAGIAALGSDESRDTSAIRNRITGFRGFGILLQQQEHGRRAADLHGLVLDNVVTDIRNPSRDGCWTSAKYSTPGCGTDEGGIWTGGVEAAVIGNVVRRARWDGIETVGSSTRTTIVDNEISDTRTGIYLEHATNDSLIARNRIVDALTGINVEWRHEGAGSAGNTFADNRIVDAKTGIFVDVGGDRHRIVRNVFVGGGRPAIVLQGSSHNVVRGNRACGGGQPLVEFSEARYDDGSRAVPKNNRLQANEAGLSAC
jgi:parallel beta-helix repeat protein